MSYYYAKEGQARGPVELVELIELATSRQLSPDDLVNRAGEPSWVAARELSELPFPPLAAPPPRTSPPPPPASRPPPAPPSSGAGPSTAGEAASPPPPPSGAAQPVQGGLGSKIKSAAAAAAAKVGPWMRRVQPLLNRVIDAAAQFMGLERIKVIPILLGIAASLLVLFSTLLVWWSGGQTMNMFGIDTVGEHYRYRGISYIEGKLVFMAVVGGLVCVGLGAMRKNWMPPALLVAAAAGTLSMVVLFGVRYNLKANAQDAITQVEQTRGMFEKISPETVKSMDQQFYATVGGGLLFGVLAALGAAAAYVVAGVFVPQRLPLFADKGPLMEHYAALIGSQLLAFLAGVIVVVLRY